MILDIKDFYYGTAMARYEYMKLSLVCIPEEIIDQYNLRSLSSNGWVYLDIRKGMPGLKKAGCISNDRLKAHLAHFVSPRSQNPCDDDSSPLLTAKKINLVQQIMGVLLYYSILVDPTMLTSLSSIAAQQSKGAEKICADTLWLLNYAVTHPNATI